MVKDFGGNIKDTPKLLLNKFGTVAANRWVSREKHSEKLKKMMSIEAPVLLIQQAQAILTGRENVCNYATCFSQKKCLLIT